MNEAICLKCKRPRVPPRGIDPKILGDAIGMTILSALVPGVRTMAGVAVHRYALHLAGDELARKHACKCAPEAL